MCSEIDHLSQSDKDQWKEIDGLKTIMLGTLITTIFTLIGVIINLALWGFGIKGVK